jgi:pimeloyl-ACP methyl ester carboxylesterase
MRSYPTEIRRERKRVATGSRILQTSCGPIEYAEAGAGPPILVIHGAGGGFDQGLDVAQNLVKHGFRVIAVSRFGYLRTPLPRDASAAAQADAHVGLLDALHIPRCAVLGVSAGGPSAMQLALRHPERVASLILMVPAAYAPRPSSREGDAPKRMPALAKLLMDAAIRSDFLFWLALRLAPRPMTRAILGTPPVLLANAGRVERARVATALRHVLPVSPRRRGLINDAAVVTTLPRYELERIAAPTLVFSARDDLYQTYAGSRYSAEHMPRARFIGYPTGGHMLVGHDHEVTAETVRFLNSPTKDVAGVTGAVSSTV